MLRPCCAPCFSPMPTVNFNHTIVYAHDSRASATFLAEVFGLPAPMRWGPFQVFTTDNGASAESVLLLKGRF